MWFKLNSLILFLSLSFLSPHVLAKNDTHDAEHINVLFIGNSFTSWLQGSFDFFLRTTEAKGDFVIHSVGGGHLGLFINHDFEYAKAVSSAINSKAWDYVVLQDRSVAVGRGDEWDDSFKNAVSELSDQIRAVGAEPVLYMTWGRDNTREYENFEDMTAKISKGYNDAGRRHNITVAPVGEVWYEVRKANEILGKELYADANGHPTVKGQILITGVFFKLFFGDSLNWSEEVSEVFNESEWKLVKQKIEERVSMISSNAKSHK